VCQIRKFKKKANFTSRKMGSESVHISTRIQCSDPISRPEYQYLLSARLILIK